VSELSKLSIFLKKLLLVVQQNIKIRQKYLKMLYIHLHSTFTITPPDSLQKCNFVWHTLKLESTENPTLHSEHMNLSVLLSLSPLFLRNTCNTKFIFLLMASVQYVLYQVELVGWWKGLVFPVEWSIVEEPSPVLALGLQPSQV
jgi:hypothetical protein